jgi:hypothetical protein
MDGAWQRERCIGSVVDVWSVSAKKESSVESFGCRLRVGTAIQSGEEMMVAHHGIAWKYALLVERGSALAGSMIESLC